VNGVPKFADIGLVTNIASQTTDVSFVGTEGYFAPEGPGTPAADVYSLGKVLYEVCTGKDRGQFPELPTDLTQREDTAALLQFNAVIMKACRLEAGERYQTARAMHEALRDLAGNTAALRTQKPG
jgi:serine/threonine protein kinase